METMKLTEIIAILLHNFQDEKVSNNWDMYDDKEYAPGVLTQE